MPPIPPYGDAPMRFAPYGEYAEAFWFTVAASVAGRAGKAGAPDEDAVEVRVDWGCEIALPG